MKICTTCNKSAAWPGGEKCANCWEVEHRIEEYARSDNGRIVLAAVLIKAGFMLTPPPKS